MSKNFIVFNFFWLFSNLPPQFGVSCLRWEVSCVFILVKLFPEGGASFFVVLVVLGASRPAPTLL